MRKFRHRKIVLIGAVGISASHCQVSERSPQEIRESHETKSLRVMTFNTKGSGQGVEGGRTIIEAIALAGADIVGVQEAVPGVGQAGNGAWFRDKLSVRQNIAWYVSCEACSEVVLSKYSIEGAIAGDGYAVRLGRHTRVAVYNRHLSPSPYGPYLHRDGVDRNVIYDTEMRHVEEMMPTIKSAVTRIKQGWPALIFGDFNTPSHLDWTSKSAELNYGRSFNWPLSLALDSYGLSDSFRQVWPDELSRPGHSWIGGWGNSGERAREKTDRIDFIYFGGQGLSVIDSKTFFDDGNSSDGTALRPWGSDHRAVVSSFALLLDGQSHARIKLRARD